MKHFENKRYLDLTDRYDIEIGLSMRHSFKKIAEDVGCHPSTVAREILENRYFIKGKPDEADHHHQASLLLCEFMAWYLPPPTTRLYRRKRQLQPGCPYRAPLKVCLSVQT